MSLCVNEEGMLKGMFRIEIALAGSPYNVRQSLMVTEEELSNPSHIGLAVQHVMRSLKVKEIELMNKELGL